MSNTSGKVHTSNGRYKAIPLKLVMQQQPSQNCGGVTYNTPESHEEPYFDSSYRPMMQCYSCALAVHPNQASHHVCPRQRATNHLICSECHMAWSPSYIVFMYDSKGLPHCQQCIGTHLRKYSHFMKVMYDRQDANVDAAGDNDE